jgi:hypothetical protein
MTGVIVKSDDWNSGMMASGGDAQVREVFEAFRILSQGRDSPGNRVDKHPCIRN